MELNVYYETMERGDWFEIRRGKLCRITHAAKGYLAFGPYLTVLVLRCLAFIKRCSKEL